MNTMKNPVNLQSGLTYLFIAIFLAAASVACNKEETGQPQSEAVSNEEIVALVEGALVADTEGLAAEMQDAAYVADEALEKDNTLPCGETFDTTVVRNYSSAHFTAAYTSNWNWTLNCNDLNIPLSLDFNRQSQGEYETPRMESSDNAEGSWTVSNLTLGANYILNGSYSRQGSQTSKVRQQNSFTSSIEIAVAELNFSKADREIVSGSATFILTGSGTGGNVNFTHQGSIVFNGNGTATLTVNGNSYDIDLNP